ncbi:hypothetical protein [Aeromicrobium sp. UC242_57]|uniref:hypothetical protein n=1 Tax=Aeromicrobium sp. UC242_57 TaxID=3374624 RepID=UPI0037A0DC69
MTSRTAVAHAAWHGRTTVTRADIRRAALLALPHRRRRNPFDAPGLDEGSSTRSSATSCRQSQSRSRPHPNQPMTSPIWGTRATASLSRRLDPRTTRHLRLNLTPHRPSRKRPRRPRRRPRVRPARRETPWSRQARLRGPPRSSQFTASATGRLVDAAERSRITANGSA